MQDAKIFYNCDAETDMAASCCYCGDAFFYPSPVVAVTNGSTIALAHSECHAADVSGENTDGSDQ
jgi:hypothetical protein